MYSRKEGVSSSENRSHPECFVFACKFNDGTFQVPIYNSQHQYLPEEPFNVILYSRKYFLVQQAAMPVTKICKRVEIGAKRVLFCNFSGADLDYKSF